MIDFLNAAVSKVTAAGVARTYKPNKVPDSPVTPYCVVFVTFDDATTYTLDAAHSVGVARVTTQSFSTSTDGASDTDSVARGGLLDQRLAVAGFDVGPGELHVGGAMVRDPDANALVGVTSTYLFAFTKES